MKVQEYIESARVSASDARTRWEGIKKGSNLRSSQPLGIDYLCGNEVGKAFCAVERSICFLKVKTDQWTEALTPDIGAFTPSTGHLVPFKVRDALSALGASAEAFFGGESKERIQALADGFTLSIGTGPGFMINEPTHKAISDLIANRAGVVTDPTRTWCAHLKDPFDYTLLESLKAVFFKPRATSLRQGKSYELKDSLDKNFEELDQIVTTGLKAVDEFYQNYRGGLDVSVITRVEAVGTQLLYLKKCMSLWRHSIGICIKVASGQVPADHLSSHSLPPRPEGFASEG